MVTYQYGYQYVVSARQKAPNQELQGPLVSASAETSEVKVAFVRSDSGEERWLYCESEQKAAVAENMRISFQSRFETDLQNLANALSKPRGRKKHHKVLERIGRLKEKHKSVSGCYDISVQVSKDGNTATALTWTLQQEKLEDRLNGHYFLRTNIQDLGAPELWQLYTLQIIFRKLRPS